MLFVCFDLFNQSSTIFYHFISFNPSVILNPKSSVTVHVTAKFECSTSFTPLKEEICAEVLVDDKKLWNTLCGLKMQTELTPLLSVDDISLRKEIGRGSYDYLTETYHNLNSLLFLYLFIDLFFCEKI